MDKLILASNNSGKCTEIKNALNVLPYEILSLKDLNLNLKILEDQNTFEGNAVKKARETMETCGEISLADDSGIEVEALGGDPGVNSAHFSGFEATDEANYTKLLKLLKDYSINNRGASFCCVIAVAFPDGRILTSKEWCYGRISLEPVGKNGFGYDPIFIPNGFDCTFAQMSIEEKNQISHRGKALRKIRDLLLENLKKDGL